MNNKSDFTQMRPEMTDKSLLLEARAIHNAAYSAYLRKHNFYLHVKHGYYPEALHLATRLNLHQTHPELYAELQTRTAHQSTES